MNQNNVYFLIPFQICLVYIILVSDRSSAAHFQYEACVQIPRNCTHGPNISFPFIIQGSEEYCGYPGFVLNCNDNGYPVLRLSDSNEYVIDQIFYNNRSVRVHNAVVSSSDVNDHCNFAPRILNTTLNVSRFDYVNSTVGLHLFSNCSERQDDRYFNLRTCGGESGDGNDWSAFMYDGDENLTNAIENCGRNVLTHVERHESGDNAIVRGFGDALYALRRGVVLNWFATDCTRCSDSGGRCGFNASAWQFQCFCPDRVHLVRCQEEG